MKSTRSSQRSRARRSTRTVQRQQSDYDTDDESLRYPDRIEEEDSADDDSICVREVFPCIGNKPEEAVSTTELVEESKMQVGFCETTAEEMNEIMQWWSSKAGMEDDTQASTCAPNNTLLGMSDLEDEKVEVEPQVEAELKQEPPCYLIFSGDQPLVEPCVASEPVVEGVAKNETTGAGAREIKSAEAIGLHDTPYNAAKALVGVSPRPSMMGPEEATDSLLGRRAPLQSSYLTPQKASSSGVLVDQAVSPDPVFYSPLGDTNFCTPPVRDPRELPDFSMRSFSSPDELHYSATIQHEEVTRLLFQTRDMADQVAALTESSATEDDIDASMRSDSDLPPKLLPPLPPRRSSLRRRRHCKVEADISTLKSCVSTSVELRWQDYGRLWLLRQGKKLETTLVTRFVVPILPNRLLVHLMLRPKTFRKQMWAVLLLLAISPPLLIWYLFQTRLDITLAPLPSVELFRQKPFFDRYYHVHTFSSKAVPNLLVEGGLDYGLI